MCTFSDPPDLLSSFEEHIRNESDTLQLHCNFTGTPFPAVVWSRNVSKSFTTIRDVRGKVSIQEVKSAEERVTNSYLQVFDLVKSDEGTYRCQGINNVDNLIDAVDSDEAFITIHGKDIVSLFLLLSLLLIVPPTIYPINRAYTVTGVKDYDYTFGFVIEFDFPKVQLHNIQWHFTNLSYITTTLFNNNSSISSRYMFSKDRRTLTIPNVQLSDRGNYTLTATNEAGVRSSTLYLNVHGNQLCIKWFLL